MSGCLGKPARNAIFQLSMLGRPAVLFKDVLKLDQRARIGCDVEADGIGGGVARKIFAAMTSESGVADLAHARLVGLHTCAGRLADPRKCIA